jgi:hypothetical protein
MAVKRETLDYDPKSLDETDGWNNSDSVEMTETSSVAGVGPDQPDPYRHLDDTYTPLYPNEKYAPSTKPLTKRGPSPQACPSDQRQAEATPQRLEPLRARVPCAAQSEIHTANTASLRLEQLAKRWPGRRVAAWEA